VPTVPGDAPTVAPVCACSVSALRYRLAAVHPSALTFLGSGMADAGPGRLERPSAGGRGARRGDQDPRMLPRMTLSATSSTDRRSSHWQEVGVFGRARPPSLQHADAPQTTPTTAACLHLPADTGRSDTASWPASPSALRYNESLCVLRRTTGDRCAARMSADASGEARREAFSAREGHMPTARRHMPPGRPATLLRQRERGPDAAGDHSAHH
jgi:hypothetical protein